MAKFTTQSLRNAVADMIEPLCEGIVRALDRLAKDGASVERSGKSAISPPKEHLFKSMYDLNREAAQREFDTFGRASWPSGAPLSERDMKVYDIR